MRFLSSATRSAGRLFGRALGPRTLPWEKNKPGLVEYDMAGQKRRASGTWFRGNHCNFHPFRASLSEPDAIEKYIGLGWFPEAPFISRTHAVTTFGSCFAAHVSKYLEKAGYKLADKGLSNNAYVIRCGEGMVNSAAIAQQFEWAYGVIEFDESLWYHADGTVAEYSARVRSATRQIFDSTDVFIITLGLSEVWYNKCTGEVFWRTIPKERFNPELHGFKILSTTENKANIETTYRRIREHRPNATIIFTLSPVPLAATFRPVSCVSANTVSKASLRVAVDEFMRENSLDKALFYFPSYELVKEFFENPYMDDLRHVQPDVVAEVMRCFSRHFLLH